MLIVFSPAWIVCIDKLMIVFYNKFMPGGIAVKWKSYPMGNKYHTIACCNTKVILFVELMKGKDILKEGIYREA